MRRITTLLLIICMLLSCTACAVYLEEGDKPTVAVSIFPAYDFVRAIAGDNVTIHLLIDPGSSVHSYDPSPADVAAVSGSDLFVYNGGMSDSWAEKILSGSKVQRTFKMMDHSATLSGTDHDDTHRGHTHTYDEHVWTSPENCVSIITALTDALCQIDSTRARQYKTNAEKYIGEITAVDKDLAEFIKRAPKNTIAVADKFPFHYLTTHYSLGHVAVFETCNDQGDADVAAVTRIIDTVKNQGLSYVYTVELTTGNIAKAVCEQTGAQALLLHSMQNVTKDDFTAGITCLDIMKANAENLKKGLS